MTVAQTDKIDMMSLDEATGTFWLTMVEDRPWSRIDPSFRELQAKTNFYIGATKDPSFAKQIPQAAGKKLGIRVMCTENPTAAALHFLGLTRAGCEHFGLSFSVRLLETGVEVAVSKGEISGINQSVPREAPEQKKPWWKF